MRVKDIRDLIMDLDDNTPVLISTKGVVGGAVRSPRYFSLVPCGSFEMLILADEPVSGFPDWTPIRETALTIPKMKSSTKHLI